MHRRTLAYWVALCLLSGAANAADDFLWIEGEHFDRGNFPPRTSFSPADADEADVLSGGQWVTHEDDFDPDLFLEYEIESPAAGTYRLYARKFWKHGPFRWRIDEGPWHEVPRDTPLLDSVAIRKHVPATWVLAGTAELSQGTHRLRIEPIEYRSGAFGLDALLLTRGLFTPRGKLKPGEKTGLADPGAWAFEPDADTFDAGARLDLRRLNEKQAGQSGFVRLSEDGNDLVLGDGTPVRFWAVNTFVYRQDMQTLRAHARFLAKRGVNLVKFHDYPYPKADGAPITDVDEQRLEWCWKLVAAMRAEGIYTMVSPYWSVNIKHVPESWGIEGWPEDRSPFGLLFFNERLQAGYRAWMRALYTRPNPYTGIPLAKDPAVAGAILQTEDSLLFYTVDRIEGEQRARLRERFGRWLQGQYGSLDAARAAWGGKAHENDDFENGEAGLFPIWQMTSDAAQYTGGDTALQKRLDDQLQFLTERMRSFNAEMVRFYREELGCEWPILAGNWKTADPATLLDAERWTYTAGDIIGKQRYTGPVHVNPTEGRRARYTVDVGDCFAELSTVRHPDQLPIAARQAAGHPWMNTESTWVSPTAYQAEGPFLIAAYGAMTGIDGYTWFAMSGPQYDPGMTKFQVANPSLLGMFPAAALIYRGGYLAEAEPVVREHRGLEEIWSRKPPLIVEGGGFDPNRDVAGGPTATSGGNLPQPVFLAGPVRVRYGGEAADDFIAPRLEQLVDLEAKTVASATGELELDYGRGICTMNAPRAQGVAGFLAGQGPFELEDATIRCGNDYAAITIVPLDGRRLSESRRVLVQVGTISRPYGWRSELAAFEAGNGDTRSGRRITALGGPPWNIERADVSITLRNRRLVKAERLDPNGMPDGAVELSRDGEALSFRFPADALYVVLSAEPE